MKVILGFAIAVGMALAVGGCGTYRNVKDEFLPDQKKVDYRKAKQAEDPLEVPPDLTRTTIDEGLAVPDIVPQGTATLSDYSRERSGAQVVTRAERVLPEQQDVRMQRDGQTHWLVVQGDPIAVWPRVREFWLQNGFLIKREDPRIGILETDWAENRADIPQDFIRRQIGKVFDSLYSAATRDKFRLRLERGVQSGTTEVYLTHRGAEEVVEGSAENVIWKPRPSDPELEVEMLRRLAVFFGIDEQRSRTLAADKASPPERAKLSRGSGGTTELHLKEGFARAWRRTGLALDRVGFTVEDRDRSRGVYYVRYIDPVKDSNAGKKKGFLSKLAFWSDDDAGPSQQKYLVSLVDSGDETKVVVLDENERRETSKTADRILSLLHEQLK